MKKLVVISVFAIMFATVLTSCDHKAPSFPTYKVKVVRLDDKSFWSLHKRVTVLTESGDTVHANILDSVFLNHKMPFFAEMQKTNTARIGWIKKSLN